MEQHGPDLMQCRPNYLGMFTSRQLPPTFTNN